MRNLQALRLTFSAALVAFALSACGGGGNDASPVMAPLTPNTAALQGIWQSASGAATSTSVIALPDGKIWAVLTSGGITRLVKVNLAALSASFAGNGKSYTLGTTMVDSVAATASVVEKNSLSGNITSPNQTETYALAYQPRYDTPAVLADYTGTWGATLGPGTVSWNIAASGVLSGTRTTGCTYTGQVSLRSEQKAVVDVAVNENCSGTLTALQGVAALNEEKTRLGMVLTTTDERVGVALNLVRP